MKKYTLSSNQMKVLNSAWKTLPSGEERLSYSNIEGIVSSFKSKYGVSYTVTEMIRFKKKEILEKYWGQSSKDSFFKKNKSLSKASFNSIPTINDFISQIIDKKNIDLIDINMKVMLQLNSINETIEKKSNILLSKRIEEYSKYILQTRKTEKCNTIIRSIDDLRSKISKKLSNTFIYIKNKTNISVCLDLCFVVNGKYVDFDNLKSAEDDRFKILSNELMLSIMKGKANPLIESKIQYENKLLSCLYKENIDMRPVEEINFERAGSNLRYYSENREKIAEYNASKKKMNEFYSKPAHVQNKRNPHYLETLSYMRNIESIIKDNKFNNVNIESSVEQNDYCNDYDSPNSYYMSLYLADNSILPNISLRHNDSEIGKSYSSYLRMFFNINVIELMPDLKKELDAYMKLPTNKAKTDRLKNLIKERDSVLKILS